jgi:DNA-binding MarR family transcriptional regulator
MSGEARRLLEEIEALSAELVRGADTLHLTTTQRVTLAAIADHGPMRLHALAERVGTTDATASRAVEALVRAALVERVADERERLIDLLARLNNGLRAA